jgi:hypothetical protein
LKYKMMKQMIDSPEEKKDINRKRREINGSR